ncbi:hypothetical protein AOLI_G00193440 [Acnodon oligacanthus]
MCFVSAPPQGSLASLICGSHVVVSRPKLRTPLVTSVATALQTKKRGCGAPVSRGEGGRACGERGSRDRVSQFSCA